MSDVSDSDRQAAVAALTVHLQSGRLSSTEFEQRQVEADAARTWAQIEALFGDLPAPHPQRPPTASPRLPGAPGVPGVSGVPGVPDARSGGVAWRPRIGAALPIVALILFFLTKSWLWFLMIPLYWALAQGPGRRGQ
jgi:hypothetical protein